jgi:hypothetical protein
MLRQIGRIEGLAQPDDLKLLVRKDAIDRFDRGPGAQIGSADAADDEDVVILADVIRFFDDGLELFLIVIDRPIDPAEEIIPAPVLFTIISSIALTFS